MSDDYLFDPSAPPDPEVQRLEGLLGAYRWPGGEPPPLPAAAPARPPSRLVPLLAAAALLVAAVLVSPRPPAAPPLADGWRVAAVEGAPRLPDGDLRPGDLVATDARSRAEVRIPGVGRVEVEPRTRLRLIGDAGGRRGLSLEAGTIRAVTTAPPRLFYVETPTATAVDLGCVFTLRTGGDGAGLLEVSSGWVAFQRGGREWLVPAGAVCPTRAGAGPGTPRHGDAPAALSAALDRVDAGTARDGDMAAILAAARPRDTLALWHLSANATPEDRGALYDRVAALAPWGIDVARERVVAGEAAALAAWAEELRVLW